MMRSDLEGLGRGKRSGLFERKAAFGTAHGETLQNRAGGPCYKNGSARDGIWGGQGRNGVSIHIGNETKSPNPFHACRVVATDNENRHDNGAF